MEFDIKLSLDVISNMGNYKDFNGHVAFLITPNGKKIEYVGKSRPLPNYGNNHGICSIHAEKAVLENLRSDNNKYNLLVFRWSKKGNLAMSKPCLNCMKCLKKNKKKINKVFYSVENGFIWDNLCNMNITDSIPSSGFRVIQSRRDEYRCIVC